MLLLTGTMTVVLFIKLKAHAVAESLDWILGSGESVEFNFIRGFGNDQIMMGVWKQVKVMKSKVMLLVSIMWNQCID